MSMGVEVWHKALPNSDAMRLPADSADLEGRTAAYCALNLSTVDLARKSIAATRDEQASASRGVCSPGEDRGFADAGQLQLDLGNAPDPVIRQWSAPVRLSLLLGGAVASWAMFLMIARLAG
jgi:hypothetical protein